MAQGYKLVEARKPKRGERHLDLAEDSPGHLVLQPLFKSYPHSNPHSSPRNPETSDQVC